MRHITFWSMPWFRQFHLHCYIMQRPGFSPTPSHIEFLVVKVIFGQVFHRILWFSPVFITITLNHVVCHFINVVNTLWHYMISFGCTQDSSTTQASVSLSMVQCDTSDKLKTAQNIKDQMW